MLRSTSLSRARRARAALGGLGLAVALTATVACAGGSAAGASVTADAASPERAARTYVALGDSYTAGPLIPAAKGLVPGCLQSTANYPSLLAERRNLQLTDVSCSGADTTNLLSPQETFAGTNPAQLDALSSDTDLVTLGMGGNDFGLFGSLVGRCAEFYAEQPKGSPCKDFFTRSGTDVKKRDARLIGERVAAAVREIEERAPDAQVIVVGYLRIGPADGTTCQKVLPFAKGDYPWVNSVQRVLNASIAKAARSEGAAFAGMYPVSLGHDACKGAKAWVNGVQTDPLRALQYHPFASGMNAIAKRTGAEIVTAT